MRAWQGCAAGAERCRARGAWSGCTAARSTRTLDGKTESFRRSSMQRENRGMFNRLASALYLALPPLLAIPRARMKHEQNTVFAAERDWATAAKQRDLDRSVFSWPMTQSCFRPVVPPLWATLPFASTWLQGLPRPALASRGTRGGRGCRWRRSRLHAVAKRVHAAWTRRSDANCACQGGCDLVKSAEGQGAALWPWNEAPQP